MDLFPQRDSGGKGNLKAAPRGPVVLDTSAVSILFRGDGRSAHLAERIRGRRAVISFQTLEELRFGAYKAGWGERRLNGLNRLLAQFEVIWPNPELVEICARLRVRQETAGKRLATADAWIAATALLLGCPLVAGDSDFELVDGLTLVSV
ncbi:MAG: PIN domain-containing protein [Rhodospirillales bacterium]|nr:PIN domain-containing protein [Rhodospirillales bacterium]